MSQFRVVIREVVQQDLEYVEEGNTPREARRLAMEHYYHDGDIKVLVGKALTVAIESVRLIKEDKPE